MNSEAISVIIPVFNGAAYVVDALDSVFQQEVQPAEIIVINDGSTDGTAEVLERFHDRIRIIHQQNQGPAAARNAGLQSASGEMLAFLDADDLWPLDHLRLLLDCLHRFPDIEVALGHIQHIHAESTLSALSPMGEAFPLLSLNCALFRRSTFDAIGQLDETMRFSEDVDWFMRAREAGIKLMLRQEVVLYYRRHQNNMTNVSHFNDLDLIKVLKLSIDRRKKKTRNNTHLSHVLKYEDFS